MRTDDLLKQLQWAPLAETAGAKPVREMYEYTETRDLVELVHDAAELLYTRGESAFAEFRVGGSRWRQGETYIFVLDTEGRMLVHLDPEMEGKEQMELEDVNGKPIIKSLIETATMVPGKPDGWYHYQWPVPGGLLPRWKSSYVQLVKLPSGKTYVVGSGMYNDRMEKAFVVDLVHHAVAAIEKDANGAMKQFHDPRGPFIAKDTYVFVLDMDGVELANPGFPSLEGMNFLDYRDSAGKYLNRELLRMVQEEGEGWVDYMFPRPGESVATQKSTFVSRAQISGRTVAVGCGVYLPNAPQEVRAKPKLKADELMQQVRSAADVLAEQGEKAYPEFRKQGSKWFHDETYLFVFDTEGRRAFHAAEPETEGRNDMALKDALGRPIVKMILDAADSYRGEGWVHYMYPEPGNIFPTWKSSYVKRVIYPSGQQYVVGCGIYNMEMDKAFVEDVVNRAAALVAEKGEEAFELLRDRKGPFVFMDTYVFVEKPDGTEVVNPGLPSLEGKNLIGLKDLEGREVIREEIEAAMTNESAWLEMHWFHPGDNQPALKQTFVRKVQYGTETYIVGSGIYGGTMPADSDRVQRVLWEDRVAEKMSASVSRQVVHGAKGTVSRFLAKKGARIARHYHVNEEFTIMTSGSLKYIFDDRELRVDAGEVVVVPSEVPHAVEVLEDASYLVFFAPRREDWLRGEDQYLRL